MSTKKMKALVIALVVMLIIAVCGYIAVDTLKSREEQAALEEQKSLSLFDFNSDSIDKVEISIPEGNFTIEDTADGWAITDTDYQYDISLNAYYINTICSYMSDLTALKKLSISTDELSGYGLDTPQKLTCRQGSEEYTIYMGNPSATEEYYYIMLPDDSTVYAIDFTKGQILKGGLDYLKDPYMITWMDVNISYIRLTNKNNTVFEIEKDDSGKWQMEEPLKHSPLNAANINSMLTSVTRLQIERFIKMAESPQDLVDYHLDNPAYQFALKTDSGETMTIDFAAFDKSDTSAYLVYEESGQIASMTVNSVSFLQTQASEIMTDKIYSPEIAEVSVLDVTVDDLHFTMNMNHEESKAYFQSDDTADEIEISGNTDEIQKNYNQLFLSVSNLTYDSLDVDAEIDQTAEPSVIFHYTLTDGTETELTLVPVDDTYYQAFLDGEYTGKIVRRRALSGTSGVLTYHEKMIDLLEMNSEKIQTSETE
ncbi:MAG: DUF4340 domain-containing protein [Oscillospiraceae bacterium]|nr:DUF4340 domain-containing protein [Oscillospiraceae bacterium]